MARLFDDAQNDTTYALSSPITNFPVTMACWFKCDDLTAYQYVITLSNSSNGHFLALQHRAEVGGDPVQAQMWNGTAYTAQYPASTTNWMHIAAGFWADGRRVWYNGAYASNSGSYSITGPLNRLYVGSKNATTANVSGRIAEVGIWNVLLSDAAVDQLAAGFSPSQVKPQNLVAYYPFFGLHSPEINLAGDINLTVVGTTKVDHPRIYKPAKVVKLQYGDTEEIVIRDDVEEADDGTGFTPGGNYVTVESSSVDSTRKNAAFRFTDIPVPNKASIISSTLYLQAVDDTDDNLSSIVYGEDVDDSENFTDTPSINSRTLTSANVPWEILNTGVITISSPDLKTIIAEITSRDGWEAGNALTIIVKGKTTGNNKYKAKAKEALSGYEATLEIEYSVGNKVSKFTISVGV